MKTAETRGIMRQHDGGVVTWTTYLCSWFESRYPSSEFRRIPPQNSLPFGGSPSGLNGPETRNETEFGCTGVSGVCAPRIRRALAVSADRHGHRLSVPS